MKLRISYIFTLLTLLPALLMLQACVDDYFYDKGHPKLEPGTPVELTLGMSVPSTPSQITNSRAGANDTMSRRVHDLYLFIFDNTDEGKPLKTKYFFSNISDKAESQCDPRYSTSGSAVVQRTATGQGLIRHVHTTAGNSKIVAVANCNRKGSAMILDRLNDEVTCFADLQKIMVSTIDATSNLLDMDSNMTVMSGYYCSSSAEEVHSNVCGTESEGHNGDVTIDSAELSGTVWLTPLQSRVKFVIDGNGHEGQTTDEGDIPAGVFRLSSWRVYNMPRETPLFCPGADNPATVTTQHSRERISFDSNYVFLTEEKTSESESINPANCFGFTFFAPDNHPGEGTAVDSYGERAAWESSQSAEVTAPENKRYINAPEGATFVVLKGTYTGASEVTESNGTTSVKNVNADVTYTIFLGDQSTSEPFNDYNTNRNVNYTYIVRVKGVNKITVEVNRENELRADAEGNVSVLSESKEMLDCHYEQRILRFTRGQIKEAIRGHNFSMGVTVPVLNVRDLKLNYFLENENKEYVLDADGNRQVNTSEEAETALKYMDWIEVYRHSPEEEARKYIPYTNPKKNDALMNVREFMADLVAFAEAKEGNEFDDEFATYTIYFNEYIYLDSQGNQIHEPTGTPVDWKQIVNNKQNRKFSLMGSTKVSQDFNSSYSTAGTVFEQRPMQTIYNTNDASLTRAWATECVEENIYSDGNKEYSYVPFQKYTGFSGPNADIPVYGRQNAWRALLNGGSTIPQAERIKFSTMIDSETGLLNTINEKSHYHECIGRNRDLNGNGKIDPNEFRWYLPSIEQYELLYIGRAGLTPDVQLYNVALEEKNFYMSNGTITYQFKHYMSSSNSKLWSEEGCSTSSNGFQGGNQASHGKMLYVRCVRDIGMDNVADQNPDYTFRRPELQFQSIYEYITGDALGGREHVAGRIRLARLNNGAFRAESELRERPGNVHTFSESNRPAYEFEVADTILSNVPVYTDHVSAAQELSTSCAEALGPGWRMPTLTELVAMSWGNRSGWFGVNLGSRTSSYFNTTGVLQDNPAWGKSDWLHCFNGKFSLQGGKNPNENTRYNIRCVRDYIPDITNDDPDENQGGGAEPAPVSHKRKLRRR